MKALILFLFISSSLFAQKDTVYVLGLRYVVEEDSLKHLCLWPVCGDYCDHVNLAINNKSEPVEITCALDTVKVLNTLPVWKQLEKAPKLPPLRIEKPIMESSFSFAQFVILSLIILWSVPKLVLSVSKWKQLFSELSA